MGFLATLVPGVRELRAPLISGLLWICFLSTSGLLTIDDIRLYVEGAGLGDFAHIATPTIIVGLAYLVGLLAHTTVRPAVLLTGIIIRKALIRLGAWAVARKKSAGPHRLRTFLFGWINRGGLEGWPLSATGEKILRDAINDRLVSAGTPGPAACEFPYDSAIRALPHCDAQLLKESDVWYQDFERLTSEVALRVAIAPPIAALGLILDTHQRMLTATLGLITCAILLLQAANRQRRSIDLLSNATYLDYIKIPIVKSVSQGLENIKKASADSNDGPQNESQWIGAMIITLHDRGYFEEARATTRRVIDLKSHDPQSPIDAYLIQHRPALYARYTNADA